MPFLRNLRRAYPDAQIDVLVGPQSGEVLEGCPYINKLIVFDTTRFHKYDKGVGEKKSFWSYVFSLRKEKYDTCFVLKRSWSSALLSVLIGARTRIGYATEGRQVLLTHSVPHVTNVHEVDSTLSVLECAGIPVADRYLESWVTQDEQNQIDQLEELKKAKSESSSPRKMVLIHAAAAHPDKLYPMEAWVKVVRLLANKHNFLPVFTGAEQDIPLYEQLQELAGVRGLNFAGKLSLRLSLALYTQLDLAVCTDSGPAHLAAAAGIPTIALFGPTDPVRWRPYTALASKKRLARRVAAAAAGTAAGIKPGNTVDNTIDNSAVTSEHSATVATATETGAESPLELVENEAVYLIDLPCRPCNYNKTCTDRPCLNEMPAEFVVQRALDLLQRN